MRGPDRAPGPRLFLDSADRAAHARWLATGLFHGVTTNPTILRRAGVSCAMGPIRNLARAAFDAGAREVQAQAWAGGGGHGTSETADLYRHTGEAIAGVDERMVVKLPATEAGFRAARHLTHGGARITITAVYAPHQALAAAALGASYVAPYYGRMGDAGLDAMAALDAMGRAAAFRVHADNDPMRVLVASIRSAADVSALLAVGCDTLTFGPSVAEEIVADPLTLAATEAFERDARGDGGG